jgi:alpha-beta hydrolase superfamily lysophospholipase
MPASLGASAILHPSRKILDRWPTKPFESVDLDGAGIRLKAWRFHASGAARGTVVYLHGVGDNRESSIGIADHFVGRGFDVVAYDSRAHGESEGQACTYGYYEKQDLKKVLDRIEHGPLVLVGTSLGGAVALQEAATDERIAAVVAVAPFSDLRTAVSERAPFFASKSNVSDALRIAETQGHFIVDDVSPMTAAGRVAAPTLIVHGDHDSETPHAHSLRIFAALREPKKLILVPNRGHHDCLTADVWRDIDAWIESSLSGCARSDIRRGSR